MAAVGDLHALRDQPFELLREMERRARSAVSGQGTGGGLPQEWVGVGFRLGGEQFVASRDEVREVLMVPEVRTRVPGTQRWLLGVANVRGHLLPLIDLKMLLGGGRTMVDRSSRVICVNHREIPAGLVVEEVSGFRRFVDGEYTDTAPPTIARCEQYLSGAFRRNSGVWPVFDLRALVESEAFLQAAAS